LDNSTKIVRLFGSNYKGGFLFELFGGGLFEKTRTVFKTISYFFLLKIPDWFEDLQYNSSKTMERCTDISQKDFKDSETFSMFLDNL